MIEKKNVQNCKPEVASNSQLLLSKTEVNTCLGFETVDVGILEAKSGFQIFLVSFLSVISSRLMSFHF